MQAVNLQTYGNQSYLRKPQKDVSFGGSNAWNKRWGIIDEAGKVVISGVAGHYFGDGSPLVTSAFITITKFTVDYLGHIIKGIPAGERFTNRLAEHAAQSAGESTINKRNGILRIELEEFERRLQILNPFNIFDRRMKRDLLAGIEEHKRQLGIET